jgi:signal peptidase I
MAEHLDRRAARSSEGGIGETISVIVQALLIALVIRTFLFQPFNIPSGSLIPTLLIGDYLFVSKYAYGYSKHSFPFSPPLFNGRVLASEPKRGEIVVFKTPADNETDYIKRVIGLPGDRIQMIDGVVHINGKAVKKERTGDYRLNDGFARETPVPMYRETLPEGASYTVGRLQQLRQHPRVPGAVRPFLHDGRQSRQLARFARPVAGWGGIRAVRKSGRSRRDHLLLVRLRTGAAL